MNLNSIFENNSRWAQKKLETDIHYFNKLSMGQKPQVFYIGCSDSRVTAEELMGVGPGEVFIYRNIANMIPNSDLSSQSVVSYAVSYLNVKHIVVCGHYNCGGVKAAMESTDLGLINPWLRNIRDIYRLHREELNSISDDVLRYDRLVELNVMEQCVNVIKTADVQKAIKERQLSVHGWVFDMRTGKLKDLKFDFAKVLDEIMEIYRIV
jgi:carbonic anhydrase